MKALVAVTVTLPIVVPVLAVLFAQRAISPGSEWSVVVAVVSIYFAAFGSLLTYEAHKLSQHIHHMAEEREQKRSDTLVRYEIPHALHSLKTIKVGMYQTMVLLEEHCVDGKIQTKEGAERLHMRAMMHADTIRSLASTFFDAELSKYHKSLDSVLLGIDEIMFVSQNDAVDVAKFKECLYVISRIIRMISTEYGIEPQETEDEHHGGA